MLLKVSEVGVAVTAAIPVPLRFAFSVPLRPELVMVRTPDCAPRDDGLKVTRIAQLLFGPRVAGLAGQLLV